jgi:hypothetical protein
MACESLRVLAFARVKHWSGILILLACSCAQASRGFEPEQGLGVPDAGSSTAPGRTYFRQATIRPVDLQNFTQHMARRDQIQSVVPFTARSRSSTRSATAWGTRPARTLGSSTERMHC